MNYKQVESLMRQGIEFFSDGDGLFTVFMGPGSVEMVNGVEVPSSPPIGQIKGVIREIKTRDVDGEYIQFGDKRGIFPASSNLQEGWVILVDGERYTIVDPRPVKPTGTVVAYRPILRRVAMYG